MDGVTIQPNRTRSAISGVATFADGEPPKVTKVGAQTLSRRRFSIKWLSIYLNFHRKLIAEFCADLLREEVGDMFAVARRTVRVV